MFSEKKINYIKLVQILEYSNTIFVYKYSDLVSKIWISEYLLPSYLKYFIFFDVLYLSFYFEIATQYAKKLCLTWADTKTVQSMMSDRAVWILICPVIDTGYWILSIALNPHFVDLNPATDWDYFIC